MQLFRQIYQLYQTCPISFVILITAKNLWDCEPQIALKGGAAVLGWHTWSGSDSKDDLTQQGVQQGVLEALDALGSSDVPIKVDFDVAHHLIKEYAAQ
jgi:hypothetical protein